jgi:hypothetical protein
MVIDRMPPVEVDVEGKLSNLHIASLGNGHSP